MGGGLLLVDPRPLLRRRGELYGHVREGHRDLDEGVLPRPPLGCASYALHCRTVRQVALAVGLQARSEATLHLWRGPFHVLPLWGLPLRGELGCDVLRRQWFEPHGDHA